MKIGIVLSGGGIRGMAHMGVLKAVESAGVKITHISGTSAGSIAGAFYAAGINPDEGLDIFMKTKLLRFIRPAFSSLGLINISRTADLLRNFFPEDRIENLKIPLSICATNFSDGCVSYFSKGPLITAIQASCCIPGIFKPIVIDGKMYVDGGVLNNFPVEPLVDECDYIIGSSCNHLNPTEKVENIIKLIKRTGLMVINHNTHQKARFCNIMVEPKGLGEINTFDTEKAELIYWTAYEEALKTIRNCEILGKILAQQEPPKGLT